MNRADQRRPPSSVAQTVDSRNSQDSLEAATVASSARASPMLLARGRSAATRGHAHARYRSVTTLVSHHTRTPAAGDSPCSWRCMSCRTPCPESKPCNRPSVSAGSDCLRTLVREAPLARAQRRYRGSPWQLPAGARVPLRRLGTWIAYWCPSVVGSRTDTGATSSNSAPRSVETRNSHSGELRRRSSQPSA
jgi:hypothetical protein